MTRQAKGTGSLFKDGKIGSQDICNLCGNSYVISNGMQKYCPDCKDEATRSVDKVKSLKYYNDNKDLINEKKRKARIFERRCKVCGKDFISQDRSERCLECRKIDKNYLQKVIYDKRKIKKSLDK